MIFINGFINGIKLYYQNDFAEKGSPKHYPHTHAFSELYFHIQGKCSYMVEDGIFDIDYGTVIVTAPNELHCVIINESSQFERYWYQIEEEALDFLGSDAPWRCFRSRPFGQNNVMQLSPERMERCLARLEHSRMLNTSASQQDAAAPMLADLLILLEEVNAHWRESENHDTILPGSLVSSALRIINRSFCMLHSVDELASALYVSREHLSRCFTAQVGVSPGKYLSIKRIEYAKSLLAQGLELDEVWPQCGWNDYSYFIYAFRRETGMTPRKYRSLTAKGSSGNTAKS